MTNILIKLKPFIALAEKRLQLLNLPQLINQYELSLALKIFLIYLSLVILGLFFNFFFVNNFIFLGEFIKKRAGQALSVGLLAIPLLIVLALVFAGTVLGILFLPALLFIYIFLGFYSFFTIALVIGEMVVKQFTFKDHPALEMFFGVSLLLLSALIPYLGIFLISWGFILGLGAVVRWRFGVR